MSKIVAVDVGFGFTKVTDGRKSQVFKSVMGEANTSPFADSLTRLPSDFPRGIEIDGDRYFVGELAEEHSVNQVSTLDFAQHLSAQVPPLAFAGLLPMCPSGEPVRVVTGLPVSNFRKYEGKMRAKLEGTHRIQVIVGEHESYEHILNIERVRVIPQPFGSLYARMLDENGRKRDDSMLTDKYAVIDVGMKTCDYAICYQSRYTERGSKSTDYGISSAYKAIANQIEEKFDVEVELFRLNRFVRRGEIKLRDKTYDLRPVRDEAFRALAQQVATDAEVLWQRDWDCRAVLVTGGGGKELFPFLKDMIKNDVALVCDDDDLRLTNVMGYQRYGEFIWGPNAESHNNKVQTGAVYDAETA